MTPSEITLREHFDGRLAENSKSLQLAFENHRREHAIMDQVRDRENMAINIQINRIREDVIPLIGFQNRVIGIAIGSSLFGGLVAGLIMLLLRK